jgi:hypothetical protein
VIISTYASPGPETLFLGGAEGKGVKGIYEHRESLETPSVGRGWAGDLSCLASQRHILTSVGDLGWRGYFRITRVPVDGQTAGLVAKSFS